MATTPVWSYKSRAERRQEEQQKLLQMQQQAAPLVAQGTAQSLAQARTVTTASSREERKARYLAQLQGQVRQAMGVQSNREAMGLAEEKKKPKKKKGGFLSKAANAVGDFADAVTPEGTAKVLKGGGEFGLDALDFARKEAGGPAWAIATGSIEAERKPILDAQGQPTGQFYRERPGFGDMLGSWKKYGLDTSLPGMLMHPGRAEDIREQARAANEERLADPSMSGFERTIMSGFQDPLTYVGPGVVKLAGTRIGKAAVPALLRNSKAGALTKALLDDPMRAQAGGVLGSAAGTQAAESMDLGPTGTIAAGLAGGFAGGALGGAGAARTARAAKTAEQAVSSAYYKRMGLEEVTPGVYRLPSGDTMTAESGQAFMAGRKKGAPERLVIPNTNANSIEDVMELAKADGFTHIDRVISRNGQRIVEGTDAKGYLNKAYPIERTAQPRANERLWFHSTRSMDYDLPDPEMAVGGQTGITQGPGVYMAADPGRSAVRYGPRTFAAEFDGNVADLTKGTSTELPIYENGPSWDGIRDSLAESVRDTAYDGSAPAAIQSAYHGENLARARRSTHATLGREGPMNGYVYKQALVDAVEGGLTHEEMVARLGRFAGVAKKGTRHQIAEAVVQNHLADQGIDALFHHSPRNDGEVLIVLNGEKARARADFKNAKQYVQNAQEGHTVEDMAGLVPGQETLPANVDSLLDDYGDWMGIHDQSGKVIATAGRMNDGSYTAVLPDKQPGANPVVKLPTREDAVKWLHTQLTKASGPRATLFNDEVGATTPRFALQAGTSAAGATLGYATGDTPEERMQRAIIGAGLGYIGSHAAFEHLTRQGLQATSPDSVTEFNLRPRPTEMVDMPAFDPKAARAAAMAFLKGSRMVNGAPTGLPPGIRTDSLAKAANDIVKLQEGVYRAAVEGQRGRFWYERSGKAILGMFGGDKKAANQFSQLVAIFSPSREIAPNFDLALRAWNQAKAGQPINVGSMDQWKAAESVMAGGMWAGRKTGNFYGNMLAYIDPDHPDAGAMLNAVTADRHMGTAYGFPTVEDGSISSGGSVALGKGPRFDFVETQTQELARQLGWTPEQTQAAIWVTEKARKSEGKLTTEKAALDFADALERSWAQVSWEAAPGQNTGHLPGYHHPSTREVDKMRFYRDNELAFTDEDGRDILANEYGFATPGNDTVGGTYINEAGTAEYNPSGQTRVALGPALKSTSVSRLEPKPEGMHVNILTKGGKRVESDVVPGALGPVIGTKGKTKGKALTKNVTIPGNAYAIDQAAVNAINAYAAGRALLLKQEAISWTKPVAVRKAAEADGIALFIGRTLSADEMRAMQVAAGPGMVPIGTADGVWMLNASDGAVDNLTFHDLAEKALQSAVDDDYHVEVFRNAGDYLKGGPDGQAFKQIIDDAGFTAAQKRASAILQPRLDAIAADYAERLGWDQAVPPNPNRLTARAGRAVDQLLEPGSATRSGAIQAGTSAAGAAAGFATGDSTEDRLQRAAIGAAAGFVGGRAAAKGLGAIGLGTENVPDAGDLLDNVDSQSLPMKPNKPQVRLVGERGKGRVVAWDEDLGEAVAGAKPGDKIQTAFGELTVTNVDPTRTGGLQVRGKWQRSNAKNGMLKSDTVLVRQPRGTPEMGTPFPTTKRAGAVEDPAARAHRLQRAGLREEIKKAMDAGTPEGDALAEQLHAEYLKLGPVPAGTVSDVSSVSPEAAGGAGLAPPAAPPPAAASLTGGAGGTPPPPRPPAPGMMPEPEGPRDLSHISSRNEQLNDSVRQQLSNLEEFVADRQRKVDFAKKKVAEGDEIAGYALPGLEEDLAQVQGMLQETQARLADRVPAPERGPDPDVFTSQDPNQVRFDPNGLQELPGIEEPDWLRQGFDQLSAHDDATAAAEVDTMRALGADPTDLPIDLPNIKPGLSKLDWIGNQVKKAIGIGVEEDPIATPAMRARKRLKEHVKSQAQLVSAQVESSIKESFEVDKQGRIQSLPGAPTIRHVAAQYPTFEPFLTPEQKATMAQMRRLIAPYRTLLEQAGVADIGSRSDVIEGGFYLPRGRVGIEGVEAPVKVPTGHYLGEGGAKGFEKAAKFETEMEGIEEGYTYPSVGEALYHYGVDAGNRALDQYTADYFKNLKYESGDPIGTTYADRMDQEVRGKYENAVKTMTGIRKKIATMERRAGQAHRQTDELDTALMAFTEAAGEGPLHGVGEVASRQRRKAARIRRGQPGLRVVKDAKGNWTTVEEGFIEADTIDRVVKAFEDQLPDSIEWADAVDRAVASSARRLSELEGRGQRWQGEADALKREMEAAQKTLDKVGPQYKAAARLALKGSMESHQIGFQQLSGRRFPVELANAANKALAAEKPPSGMGAGITQTIDAMNSLMRGLRATGDASFLGIQGLLGGVSDPKAFARATGVAYRAMADPETLGTYINEFDARAVEAGRPTSKDWGRRGLHVGGSDTEYAIQARGLSRLGQKVQNLPVVKQSNRMFGYFGDTMRMEMADNLAETYLAQGKQLTPELMDQVANHVNLATGWSPNTFGGSVGRLAQFAPRFFQSQLELLSNAVKLGSIEGSLARKSMLKLMGVSVGLTALANWASPDGLDPEEWFSPFKDPLDPTSGWNPNFMRFRVGSTDMSILGPWDSLLRGLVETGGAMANAVPGVEAEGDATYFLRTKASPTVGLAWDLLSGENFLGEKSMTPDYFARSILPFSIADLGRGQLSAGGAAGVALGAAGIKAAPLSSTENLNRVAQAQHGQDFYDLEVSQQKAIKESHPELWQRAVERGSADRRRSETVRQELEAKQAASDQAFLSGKSTREEWIAAKKQRTAELAARRKEIYGEMDRKKPKNALDRYFLAIDEATNEETGEVDWDQVDAFEATTSQADQEYVARNTGLNGTPLTKLYTKLSREYYALPKYRGYDSDQARAIDALYTETANRARGDSRLAKMKALKDAAAAFGADEEIVKAVRRRIFGQLQEDRSRAKWKASHPEAALFLGQGGLQPDEALAIRSASRTTKAA